MEFLKDPKVDWLGKSRFFVAASLLLVIGSAALVTLRGPRYGVEFSGGTQIIARFSQPPQIDQIRSAVARVAPGATIQTYDEPSKNEVLIRIADTQEPSAPEAPAPDQELGALAQRALAAVSAEYATNPVLESSAEIVGPIVGAELRRKAVQLTVLALLFQLIYIGIRFKGVVWGSGAAIAVVHDVVLTLGVLTLAGYEITLNVIAALLTIVGYSVNDTIVIFDRARENLRQHRKAPFATILNDSINQTLSRTLISSATTLFAVLGLYLFGGEVLRGFGFTMVVGILLGTYSTVYISCPIVVWWRGRGEKPSTSAKAA
jgi:preprotein translocase subunit SecF